MNDFQSIHRHISSPLFSSGDSVWVKAAKTRMHGYLSTCLSTRFSPRFTSEGDSNHEIEVSSA